MTRTLAPFDLPSWKESVAAAADKHGKFAVASPSATTVAPTPSTTPVAPVIKPIATRGGRCIRPNGEEYFPRKVSIGGLKTTDVDFLRTAYAERKSALFSGAPGCGKTALVEGALDDVITLQGSLDTESADLEGTWVQSPDGTYNWEDGPLVRAAEKGVPFLIDEMALIDSRALASTYSLMDGRGVLNVSANPLRPPVVAKDGFVVYGCYNPDVPGAVVSDAMLSRFTLKVDFTTDWKVAARLGVCTEAVTVAQNLNIKAVNNEISAAPQLRELIAFRDVERIYGLDVAIANLLSFAHPEDMSAYQEAAQAIWAKMPKPLTF